jgi:hypothetical protein
VRKVALKRSTAEQLAAVVVEDEIEQQVVAAEAEAEVEAAAAWAELVAELAAAMEVATELVAASSATELPAVAVAVAAEAAAVIVAVELAQLAVASAAMAAQVAPVTAELLLEAAAVAIERADAPLQRQLMDARSLQLAAFADLFAAPAELTWPALRLHEELPLQPMQESPSLDETAGRRTRIGSAPAVHAAAGSAVAAASAQRTVLLPALLSMLPSPVADGAAAERGRRQERHAAVESAGE